MLQAPYQKFPGEILKEYDYWGDTPHQMQMVPKSQSQDACGWCYYGQDHPVHHEELGQERII